MGLTIRVKEGMLLGIGATDFEVLNVVKSSKMELHNRSTNEVSVVDTKRWVHLMQDVKVMCLPLKKGKRMSVSMCILLLEANPNILIRRK